MMFRTFGSFRIPLDDFGNVPDDLSEFWAEVEAEKPNLRKAKGCYVFGIRTSGGSSIFPWYVGKTLKSFEKECFQSHKIVKYQKALSYYKRAVPRIFLISRLTAGGAFYKGATTTSIDFLERHLISLGLQANKDLLNKKDTKLYREVQLRGILNSTGKPDPSASQLRRAFHLR